jgi:hypothetical protein
VTGATNRTWFRSRGTRSQRSSGPPYEAARAVFTAAGTWSSERGVRVGAWAKAGSEAVRTVVTSRRRGMGAVLSGPWGVLIRQQHCCERLREAVGYAPGHAGAADQLHAVAGSTDVPSTTTLRPIARGPLLPASSTRYRSVFEVAARTGPGRGRHAAGTEPHLARRKALDLRERREQGQHGGAV